MIALCSSLNTTTLCLLYNCTYVHLTDYNSVVEYCVRSPSEWVLDAIGCILHTNTGCVVVVPMFLSERPSDFPRDFLLLALSPSLMILRRRPPQWGRFCQSIQD